MYYINKIVGFIASPIGFAIAAGIAATVFAQLKQMRIAKWIGIATVAWLWFWMTPFAARFVGAPLEREFLVDGRVPAVESFPDADAIVVLGGSMGREEALSPYAEMWTSADRIWQAARLWKAGKAPKIIATGDGAKESTLGLLIDFGVNTNNVTFIGARNTEEEARAISEKGCKSILLVTSAWHMKRARMMFEKYAEGVEVVCAPADFEMSMVARRGFSILPDVNVFSLNSIALHEWVGILGYKYFR